MGTVHSYWAAQMELLEDHPPLDLFDRDWVIHTRSEERPPARIGATANVHRSLISHGCVVNGTVERSVLSPGVRVDPGAIVRDSVIMFDTVVRAGAVVDRAIVDKEVSIGPNAVVGTGADFETRQRRRAGTAEHGHHRGRQAGRHPCLGAHRSQRAHLRGGTARRLPVPAGAQRWQRRATRPPVEAAQGLTHPAVSRVDPRTIDGWLTELGLEPLARAEREGVSSWDLELDGRRRPSVRLTLILDPARALLLWVHFAPPLNDSFRVSYRQFLRWNDELPFVKFALSDDDRPVLTTELPVHALDRDELGRAVCRLLAVCDLTLERSVVWLYPGARSAPPMPRPSRQVDLFERYAEELAELLVTPGEPATGTATAMGSEPPAEAAAKRA